MQQARGEGAGGHGLGRRFLRLVELSFVHAPLALLLAFASAAVLFALLFVLPLPVRAVEAAMWLWLVAGHSLFVAFLCAWIGLPRVASGERLAAASGATLRALLPTALLVGAAGLVLVFAGALPALALWVAAVLTAAPARLLDRVVRGFSEPAPPMAVPPLQRALLAAPSLAFLVLMALILRDAPGGIMDGAVVTWPLLGLASFWAFYSAALLSAAFAWEEVLAD